MTDAGPGRADRESKPPAGRRGRRKLALPANVILLQQRIMPRHKALLARWLEAGRCMGLCDASIYAPARDEGGRPVADYIMVWVRENIDPAYMIRPDGTGWRVIDAVRQNDLARTSGFAAALHAIRPVLKLDEAA